VTIAVAAVLLLMLALLIVLAWGLMGMAKGNGRLVINVETAAIPPKIKFHIEYTSPDRPLEGIPELPSSGPPPDPGLGGGDGVT
jgi:hypothetical protein